MRLSLSQVDTESVEAGKSQIKEEGDGSRHPTVVLVFNYFQKNQNHQQPIPQLVDDCTSDEVIFPSYRDFPVSDRIWVTD